MLASWMSVALAVPLSAPPPVEAPVPMSGRIEALDLDLEDHVVVRSRGKLNRLGPGGRLESLGPSDLEVHASTVSEDGRWSALLGWSDDAAAYSLRIRDLRDGSERVGPGVERVAEMAFSPDGSRLAIVASPEDGWTALYVVEADAETRTRTEFGDCDPRMVMWSASDRISVGCADDTAPGGIRRKGIDPSTGQPAPSPPDVRERGPAGWIAWRNRLWMLIDPATNGLVYAAPSGVAGLAVSDDGRRGALLAADALTVVSIPDGAVLHRWETGDAPAHAVAFSHDGSFLAAAQRSSIHRYDLRTGREITSAPAHRDEVHALVTTVDGRVISGDRTGLRLIRTPSGGVVPVADGTPIDAPASLVFGGAMASFVLQLGVSDDGARAASVHPNRIEVFDATTGRSIATFPSGGAVDGVPRIEVPAGPVDNGCIRSGKEGITVPAFDRAGRRLLVGTRADPIRGPAWVQLFDVDRETRLGAWVLSDQVHAVGFDDLDRPIVFAGTRIVRLDGATAETVADGVTGAWLNGPGGRMAWSTGPATAIVDGAPISLGPSVRVLGWQAGTLIATKELGDGRKRLYRIDRRTLEPVARCPDLSYPVAFRPPGDCAFAEIMRGAVHLGEGR